jgi:hypothetical protein
MGVPHANSLLAQISNQHNSSIVEIVIKVLVNVMLSQRMKFIHKSNVVDNIPQLNW